MLQKNKYGSMWWGNHGFPGFFFKKHGGGGVHRSFVSHQACGEAPQLVYKYIPGAGVGATTIANRRAMRFRAYAPCRSGR